MRDNLKVGDEIVTIDGMIATISKVEEEKVILEVGPNRNKMPFEKWAVASIKNSTNN